MFLRECGAVPGPCRVTELLLGGRCFPGKMPLLEGGKMLELPRSSPMSGFRHGGAREPST